MNSKTALKARTSRNNEFAKDNDIKNSTLIFLKSPYKMEFYKVNKEHIVLPLSFLEAANLFEAKANELSLDIPTEHFSQVQAALNEFDNDNDFLGASNEVVTTTDKADAITAQAKKFLRDFKAITRNANTKKAADALMVLIDKGTFTPLPNEIRKLKRQIDKKTFTYGQADNLIIGIAEKYDAFDNDLEKEDFEVEIELNISPEIVITETFKQ